MDFGLLQGIWTVIVLISFLAIIAWAWSSKRKKDFDEAANLPFKNDKQNFDRQEHI